MSSGVMSVPTVTLALTSLNTPHPIRCHKMGWHLPVTACPSVVRVRRLCYCSPNYIAYTLNSHLPGCA